MPGEVETSAVVEFYNNAIIFLTGGTGFMGKVLTEKLFRVCPNIGHIYMLVRVKKGRDPQSRLKELFDDPLFKKIRNEHPDFEKKVTCIPGDVAGLKLNMSDSDYEFLTNEVTHVIHSAATVRFNESLKTAVQINVRGTREVLEFCKKCIRLKIFVHISTAYANCVRQEVDEVFYEPPLSSDKILTLVETLTEEKLEMITPELIKPWPNTYCYTKAIAESIIKETPTTFPVVVFRPSIVMGTLKEPIGGWIDNIYGPTGILIAAGIGLLRVMHADENTVANIIPVDLTINALITSSWDAGCNSKNQIENSTTEKESDKVKTIEPKIYNFTVDKNNSISWSQFLDMNLENGCNYPSQKAIWYITVTMTNVRIWYLFLSFFFHYIPGVLSDGILILLGKKPQMRKAYQKIHQFVDLLYYFASSSWTFHNYNRQKLWSRLSEKDKEIFNFEIWKINWKSYLKTIVLGIRSYLLKESDEHLPSAKRKHFFLWLAHRILQFSFLACCFWVMSKLLLTCYDLRAHIKDMAIMPPETLRNST